MSLPFARMGGEPPPPSSSLTLIGSYRSSSTNRVLHKSYARRPGASQGSGAGAPPPRDEEGAGGAGAGGGGDASEDDMMTRRTERARVRVRVVERRCARTLSSFAEECVSLFCRSSRFFFDTGHTLSLSLSLSHTHTHTLAQHSTHITRLNIKKNTITFFSFHP